MPKDIVIEYDIQNFKIGDYVRGPNYSGDIISGYITSLDFKCVDKMRFQVRQKNGVYGWCRLVELADENEN